MITRADALTYAGTGRLVKYTSRGGETVEEGVITSVIKPQGDDTDWWVFVRYRGDLTAKATHPDDLEWVSR